MSQVAKPGKGGKQSICHNRVENQLNSSGKICQAKEARIDRKKRKQLDNNSKACNNLAIVARIQLYLCCIQDIY
jgi:hypothetical protein